MCASISVGWWRSSAITATPSSSPGAAPANTASVSRPSAPGVVVRPHRVVAELGAASGERRGDLGIEAGRDPESPATSSGRIEDRDALDVRRLREHVDRLHPPQRIARLDDLGRIRAPASSGCRRRRRSAAPRTRAGGERPSSTGPSAADRRRPRPGARPRSSSGRDPEPGVGADEAGVGDPVRGRVVLGVGDRVGDALEAPDLARPPGEREADGADSAVEVEESLAAGEAGALAGDRVQALGHLGVRLQEGGVREPQAQPAELLGDVLGAEDAGGPVGAAGRALDDRMQVDRWPRDLARRGDQAGLDLARAPALADDEVAKQAGLRSGCRRRRGPDRGPTRGPRCGPRCWPRRRAGSRRRRRSRPSCRVGGSRGRGWPGRSPNSTRACCGSAIRLARARSARARTRRDGRSAAAPRRPALLFSASWRS